MYCWIYIRKCEMPPNIGQFRSKSMTSSLCILLSVLAPKPNNWKQDRYGVYVIKRGWFELCIANRRRPSTIPLTSNAMFGLAPGAPNWVAISFGCLAMHIRAAAAARTPTCSHMRTWIKANLQCTYTQAHGVCANAIVSECRLRFLYFDIIARHALLAITATERFDLRDSSQRFNSFFLSGSFLCLCILYDCTVNVIM